jgi:hypothetical protein
MNQPTMEPGGPATLAPARGHAPGHGPVTELALSEVIADGEIRLGRSRWAGALRDFSPLDWLLVAFFSVLVLSVVLGTGVERGKSFALLAADWLVLGVGLALTRGAILGPGSFASALVYRFTIFGTVASSYFQLRVILPAASSRAVDASLYAFDLKVFGVEPCVAWDRFVSPQSVEWFAFFYFGYFFILALNVLPFMFLGRNLHVLARFAFGMSMVFCVGHVLYVVVPGYGPYAYLAGSFGHELSGGTFWRLVQEAVASAGAQKDIFPSLHTAVPSFLAVFSFRHRRDQWPFRYTWPLAAFAASQIVLATMFLRWHYLVDILAGLTLAVVSDQAAERLVSWDERRRAAARLPPAWAPLFFGAPFFTRSG